MARRREGLVVVAVAWWMGVVSCLHAEPDDRAQVVVQQLRGHRDGASIFAAAPPHALVFAAEAGVSPDGVVRLEADMPTRDAAARYAHLLVHLAEGMPFEDDARGPCRERLRRARQRELRAIGVENTLRRAWGLSPLPMQVALERSLAGYRARCREPATASGGE
ncbi:MAG: hypothetical protein AAF715_25000 [Myxococcota bacterium]